MPGGPFGWYTRWKLERDAARWLAELSDDPVATQPALKKWLSADPRRRVILNDLAAELDLATAAGRSDPNMVRRIADARVHPMRRWPWIIAATAAVGGVTATVVMEARHSAAIRAVLGFPDSQAYISLATVAGERRQVRLTDGSSVLLDGGTAMRISYDERKRLVALASGRARFRVAHDERRPFSVTAGGGSIRAVGTLFDVWIMPGDRVQVTLLRGAVDVRPSRLQSDVIVPATRLRAGQQITFSPLPAHRNDQMAPKTVPSNGSAWMNETQDFDYVPLRDVVAEANRHSSRPIVLASAELGEIEVFGTFQIRDTERLAGRLAASLDLTMTVESDRIVLSKGH